MDPCDLVKQATAGADAARRILEKIGLTGGFLDQTGFTPGALSLFGESFRLPLTGPAGKTVTVTLYRPSPPRPPSAIEISLDGAPVPAAFIKWRETALARMRSSGIDLSSLVKELLSDPETVIERSLLQESPSTVRRWGKENQWRIFFCDRELEQMGNKNFIDAMSHNKVLEARHTDHECVQTPIGTGFFNFTNRRFKYGLRQRAPIAEGEIDFSEFKLSTDVNDMDVVRGTTSKKLDGIMDCIRENFKGSLTVFINCCVPMLTGDDIQRHVHEMQNRDDLHFVFLDQMLSSAVKPFLEPLNRIKNSPGFFDVAPVPDTINLVGYEMDWSMKEMVALLEKTGIRINLSIFPEYPLDKFKSYMAASLQVAFSTDLFQGVFEEFFNSIPMKIIFPVRPYGVDTTREWFKTIAAEFGKLERFEDVWNDYFSEFSPALGELRNQAAGFRVGIILDAFQIDRFFNSEITLGIPLPRTIEEMGFGMDFFIYSDLDELYEARKQLITSRLARPEAISIRRFDTPDELDALLRGSKLNAVYSDFFYDTRLTRRGLAQFSVDIFEKGLAGYVRSLRRLLKICRLPFYSKYGAFLED